jgi:hypothetical protein
LEVVRFLDNLGGCTFLVQSQDVVGILLGLGNWRVPLAWAGELEVTTFCSYLRMRLLETQPHCLRGFLPAQHADHVEDAGLTVRLGSTWMVRRQGDGGGSSSPALMTASSRLGGRCTSAIRVARLNRAASSRELSMSILDRYLTMGIFLEMCIGLNGGFRLCDSA